VICIDDCGAGAPANLSHLTPAPRLSVVRHDLARPLPAHLPRLSEIYNFGGLRDGPAR
jgi:hypothetical protein